MLCFARPTLLYSKIFKEVFPTSHCKWTIEEKMHQDFIITLAQNTPIWGVVLILKNPLYTKISIQSFIRKSSQESLHLFGQEACQIMSTTH